MCREFDSPPRHTMRNSWLNNSNIYTYGCWKKYKNLNNNNTVILLNKYLNLKLINNFLKILKFKLKGKTLKFKRLGSFLFTFRFGITHSICSWLDYGNFFKKKAKQKFFFFGYSSKNLIKNSKYFIKLKKPNIYHWRGIRVVRTLMFRKAGKVSEYMK